MRQTRIRTVLYCTVLCCTVLYCILTSHEDEGAAGYEADQGAGGEEVETLRHGAAPVLRHRLGTGTCTLAAAALYSAAARLGTQIVHVKFLSGFPRFQF